MTRRTFTLSPLLALLLPSACKSKTRFVGLQVELSKARIDELRERARNLSPKEFDTAEVMLKIEGHEQHMTYEEFIAKVWK